MTRPALQIIVGDKPADRPRWRRRLRYEPALSLAENSRRLALHSFGRSEAAAAELLARRVQRSVAVNSRIGPGYAAAVLWSVAPEPERASPGFTDRLCGLTGASWQALRRRIKEVDAMP